MPSEDMSSIVIVKLYRIDKPEDEYEEWVVVYKNGYHDQFIGSKKWK